MRLYSPSRYADAILVHEAADNTLVAAQQTLDAAQDNHAVIVAHRALILAYIAESIAYHNVDAQRAFAAGDYEAMDRAAERAESYAARMDLAML